MKKIIVVASLTLGVIFIAGCSSSQPTQTPIEQSSSQSVQAPPIQPVQPQTSQSAPNSNSGTAAITELKIETIKPGTGAAVKTGDTVSVQYTGTLTDGTKFDSSLDPGRQPFTFTVGQGQVIKGWDQGLIGMKVGEERKLTIPSSLGYGPASVGSIPPNSTLIFDIQLVSIK